MILQTKYLTLSDKVYRTDPQRYKINWNGKSPSKIQFEAKQFFSKIWFRDFVCEEFLIHPFFGLNYRIDIINLTKMVACEIHGSDAHVKYNPFWHKTEDDFWDAIERDRVKQMWCSKNKFTLIELYPQNFPLDLEWLKKNYPSITWPRFL